MDRAEAAQALGCAISTVGKHIREGRLKEVRAKGFAGLPRAEVEALKGVVGTRRTQAQIDGHAPQLTSRERQQRAFMMRSGVGGPRRTLEQIRVSLGYASISGVQRAIAAYRGEKAGGGHASSGRLRRRKAARRGARDGA